MRFGFDIDDTLINLREHAFHLYNKKLQQNVPIEIFQKLNRVEIHEPFGFTDEEGKEMWKSNLEEIYFTSCPVYPHAKEVLLALQQQGHDLYYITSRPKEYRQQTKEWLIERGFPVKDEHFFCGMKDSEKVHIIQELQLDYYVDDKPEVLVTLMEQSKTKVFVKDQSYNRRLKLPRIYDWKELSNLIKNVYMEK